MDSPFRELSGEGWTQVPEREGSWNPPLPVHYRGFELDRGALDALLATAPLEGSSGAPRVLALPYPDGRWVRFTVEESPILEPELAARFPEIRTFAARGIDDPSSFGRLSLTSLGFHAMVLATAGTVYIDPWRRGDDRFVISYFHRDARRAADNAMTCETESAVAETTETSSESGVPDLDLPAIAPSGATLRTYRLALAATGEYSTAVCAPNPVGVPCAMNAIVVSMNRVGGIYEREVAVRMVLVANNDLVVYTNGATDPYTNGSGGAMLAQNQTNLDAVIEPENYDIGHVFSTGGGGVASLNVPCTASKARGVTGRSVPIGDAFDVDYVAHEMGHQFGGAHTFNGTTGACSGNRSASSAYEPGSGSTIMAYAGICGAEDLQPNSDDTFHVRSFDQIVAFTTGGSGNNCPVQTATGNSAPSVDAGPAFTIPRQTPFTLTGSAVDPEGDALTYLWEEFDLGSASPPNDDVAAVRPIFRTFVPLSIPERTFPRMSDVLGNVVTLGESMSTRNRTMTFRLTARDNRPGGGGVDYDSTTVTVSAAAGPFQVTAPNTAVIYVANTIETVTWDVAGTDAAPVSCANVKIDFSIDGGESFSELAVASTPNDGSEAVTVPNVDAKTNEARLRVACVGNVFFDVSNADFTIQADDIVIFVDGFETGGLGEWSTNGTEP